MVHEREFEALYDGDGSRELHYQPVTDPSGRVVAVSIDVHQPARPELQRARSMQQLTDLAAGISHEHNNLLNVLMSNSALLADRLRESGDEESIRRLEKIETAVRRSTRFTRQLQAFSRTSVSQPEPINVSELIDELVDSLSTGLASNIDLVVDLELDLPEISADRNHWKTAVTNLVNNSAREMRNGGKLQLRTRHLRVTPKQQGERMPVGPGNYVVLEVSCEGPAMADWVHEGSFDPFFITRRVDHHAGLELATVKRIIEQGSGQISAESDDDHTTVRVYYPVTEASADEDEVVSRGSVGEPTILLVEDETVLCETFSEILRDQNFKVLTAATVAEGRVHLRERGEQIDLLITDVALPDGSGAELVDEFDDRRRPLDVIYISGHSREHLPPLALRHTSASRIFLQKPVPIPTLLHAVEELINGEHI